MISLTIWILVVCQLLLDIPFVSSVINIGQSLNNANRPHYTYRKPNVPISHPIVKRVPRYSRNSALTQYKSGDKEGYDDYGQLKFYDVMPAIMGSSPYALPTSAIEHSSATPTSNIEENFEIKVPTVLTDTSKQPWIKHALSLMLMWILFFMSKPIEIGERISQLLRYSPWISLIESYLLNYRGLSFAMSKLGSVFEMLRVIVSVSLLQNSLFSDLTSIALGFQNWVIRYHSKLQTVFLSALLAQRIHKLVKRAKLNIEKGRLNDTGNLEFKFQLSPDILTREVPEKQPDLSLSVILKSITLKWASRSNDNSNSNDNNDANDDTVAVNGEKVKGGTNNVVLETLNVGSEMLIKFSKSAIVLQDGLSNNLRFRRLACIMNCAGVLGSIYIQTVYGADGQARLNLVLSIAVNLLNFMSVRGIERRMLSKRTATIPGATGEIRESWAN